MESIQTLQEIARELDPAWGVTTGRWFGMPCLKVGGKVFAALRRGDMAFKLGDEAQAEALQLNGAELFDPRGQGHPMREWVQVPALHSAAWRRLARLACQYVATAAQKKKDELISGLVEVRSEIIRLVLRLSPTEQDEVFLGVWSAKDLVAHLAGWDDTNREAVKEILAGQKPGFFQHHDRDWQSYNAHLVEQYRREDMAELVAVVERSQRELVSFLQTVPAEVYGKTPGISRLLRAETKDERIHRGQVEAFVERCAARRLGSR